MSFEVRRSADSPLEYTYSLQLKAWKRYDLGNMTADATADLAIQPRPPAFVNQVLNRINYARETIQGARLTVLSLYVDFDATIGNGLRQISLALEDTKGLTKTLWDFPTGFAKYVSTSVMSTWNSIKTTIKTFDPSIKAQVAKIQTAVDEYTVTLGKSTRAVNTVTEVLADPANAQITSSINVDQLPLSNSATTAYKSIVASAHQQFNNRASYAAFRDQVDRFTADYADKVGMGDPTYNRIIGKANAPFVRPATEEDTRVLLALADVQIQLGRLAAYENPVNTILTSEQYVAGLANQSDIAFRVPNSKLAVPFPYGSSLETLAARYLGDANRWYEIATLNNLREPYVDEVGFVEPLTSNGYENRITLSDVSQLVAGQLVYLYSNTQIPEPHTIIGIEALPTGTFLVTLDGPPTLDRFTTAQNANLHAFLPWTVNSQQIVYIPSDEVVQQPLLTIAVPGVSDLDHMLQVGGIDLLLTTAGDLALTPDGDCRLAYGMQNIIQHVKVALLTPKGTMLQHLNYGFPLQVGTNMTDFTAKQILNTLKNMFNNDPAITNVSAVQVEVIPPVVRISMELQVRGSDAHIPIYIDVRSPSANSSSY